MSRALVLGGGGPVGIAWECGLLNGLAEAGVDVARADFIMGTSAGSFVGARLAMGHDPRRFAAPFLKAPVGGAPVGGAPVVSAPVVSAPVVSASPPAPAQPNPGGRERAPADLSILMKLMEEAQNSEPLRTTREREGGEPSSPAPSAAMVKLGQYALSAQTMSEDVFIASFGSFLRELPDDAWPERPYACTAVDAQSGAFTFWTALSKVGLKHAVASSCAVPGVYPPITIKGRRYMDGGMRSGLNADLAVGYDKVLVVAVRTQAPGPMGERLASQQAGEFKTLRDQGADVRLLAPDAASLAAMGPNLMDFRARTAAAAAGLAQGKAHAPSLVAFWT